MDDLKSARCLSPDQVEKCMSSMQDGTQMIKLRGSSKGLVRFYYLDEHKSCIRWRPSRKNEKAKISIDSIQEVCEGKQSEIFQRYGDGSFDPNRCFTIYYGDHMESLDLVSSNGEEARMWITGLKYLMAGISDEDSLSKRQRTRDQWLKQTFDEADKNGDGSLSINEVLQLMHKLNVNLPRQKVKQMFKEADTDDNQGTLDFEEFCAFYKMMSTRRDLYLLMLTYSNHKDFLDAEDIRRFLDNEQKMSSVTKEHCLEIINQFEPCLENRQQGVLGIDGFTSYMRSPAGDIFNPKHYQINQDMTRPLGHYFIASSHNTYLMGDQLMSQSRVDMYAWVLQSGCRCVEVDCWDGPDGEPIVHHGYTLTSKILFKDVIETINKYAFIKSEYPVILSIENHCSVTQQKKMAQYLVEILGDKLDLSAVNNEDANQLPSPESLKGKILVKGKKLPANISEDAEEGDVSDEDSADEMDDDCKLMNGDASSNRKRVENLAKKKLDSLIKESKIRDCEDQNNFAVTALPSSGKLGNKPDLKKIKHEENLESGEDSILSKRHNRSLMGSLTKRKKKSSKLKRTPSLEDGEDDLECQGNLTRTSVHYSKTNRQKKTMKLSRALSDLVKYTRSVGIHDVESEISSSWQVSSFSETKAHQILQQKPAQYLRFNQHQLSRIYPSSYRVDSSNYNPQPFWNAGCQLVALNYQSEGRMLQLNRAKFGANGNCGYILKPKCMCQGIFNPNSEDPLAGQMKKQLVLRIISGQQLPKPRDSMLGDRGEIIDPFVEVEVIGLPTDCCKEQTRVVDDNGFNPMWEETLVFNISMPEIALLRFLVWDHDPIGRDFIGQRTIAFTSMMPGYRHVYLEGIEEASVFVHVTVNDVCGKVWLAKKVAKWECQGPRHNYESVIQRFDRMITGMDASEKNRFGLLCVKKKGSPFRSRANLDASKVKPALGIKSLFLRSPKQASLDSHVAGQLNRKHSFSSQLLRRTASAPTKSLKKPKIALDARDSSSEGASKDPVLEDASHPRFDQESDLPSPAPSPSQKGVTRTEADPKGSKGKVHSLGREQSGRGQGFRDATFSEPIRRSSRIGLREPAEQKQGIFARCAVNEAGRIGMATYCMKCVVGSSESPEVEGQWSEPSAGQPASGDAPHCGCCGSSSAGEERVDLKLWGIQEQPRARSDLHLCASYGATRSLPRTCQPFGTSGKKKGDSACLGAKDRSWHRWRAPPGGPYRSTINLVSSNNGSVSSSSSSLDSLESPDFPKGWPESALKQAGTLQREMNALFSEKMEEIRSKSPIFFTDVHQFSMHRSAPSLCSLQTIHEEPFIAHENQPHGSFHSLPLTHLVKGDPKEDSVPHPSQGVPDGRDHSGCLERTSQLQPWAVPEKTFLSPGVSEEEEETGSTKEEAEGQTRTPCNGGPLHAQGQHNLASDNCQLHPTGNGQVDGLVQQLTSDEKNSAGPPRQRESNTTPTPLHTTPKGTVAVPVPPTVARRSKDDGYRRCDHGVPLKHPENRFPTPEVYWDATVHDRIWSKLDFSTHRDSMSSSSSMSSNDTVIDLSLPNLARKSLPDLGAHKNLEVVPPRRTARPWSANAAASGHDAPTVTKSKSNPNLRSDQPTEDDLCPRPLGFSSVSRRYTWNRLYMESLKPSCPKSEEQKNSDPNHLKSKSLGDLTSDDITSTSESKYRSIHRGFAPRSAKDQHRRAGAFKTSGRSSDELTERLKKLTFFQQENDITSPTCLEPPKAEEEKEEEEEETILIRRSSSRSQSRVRYIANRARQAQERQKLKSLALNKGSPIEERGIPEGACCFPGGPYTDPASPGSFTSQLKNPTGLNPDTEVVLTFKL